MPRGAPDDSDVLKYGSMRRLDDMAELAARLGSLMLYHRFGDVVYMTDFSTGFTDWDSAVEGMGGEEFLSSTYSVSGGVSMQLTVYDGADDLAGIYHEHPPLDTIKMGFLIRLLLGTGIEKVTWIIRVYDDGTQYIFRITLDETTGKLYYRDSENDDVEIATHGQLALGLAFFHESKMVIEYNAKEYDYFYLDQSSYDLSDIVPYSEPTDVLDHLVVEIMCGGDQLADREIYVDNAIITQNEE